MIDLDQLAVDEDEISLKLDYYKCIRNLLKPEGSTELLHRCKDKHPQIDWDYVLHNSVFDDMSGTVGDALVIVNEKCTACKRKIRDLNDDVMKKMLKTDFDSWVVPNVPFVQRNEGNKCIVSDPVSSFSQCDSTEEENVGENVIWMFGDPADVDWDAAELKGKQLEFYNESNDYETPVMVKFVSDGCKIPTNVLDKAKDYQKEAIELIFDTVGDHEDGVLIAHVMGSGKTFTTLISLQGLWNQNPHMKILVAVPKSLTQTWVDEYEKWRSFLTIRMFPILRTEDSIILKDWYSNGGILVVHHELFVKLTSLSPDVLVVDEAHKVQNVKTKLYGRIQSVQTKRRIFLTGTPLANNLMQYYTMLDLLCRASRFGDRELFKKDFYKPISIGLLKDASTDERLEAKKKIQVFMRMGEGVIHRVNEERHLYALPTISEFKCLYHVPGVPKMKENKEGAILIMARTHEVSLHSKMLKASSLIESIKNHRPDDSIIVFSSTISVLQQVAKHFDALLITGDTKDKEAVLARFKNKENLILCITKKIGSCGLNLQVANRVLLLDPDWNPAVDAQAVARVYRNGQTKEVVVYRFVVQKSVEEYIYRVAANKTLSSMHVVDDKSMKRVFDAHAVTYGNEGPNEKSLSRSEIGDKSLDDVFATFKSIHNYSSTFKENNNERLDERHVQEATNDYNKLCASSSTRLVKDSSGEIKSIPTGWTSAYEDDKFLVKPPTPYWRKKKGRVLLRFASVEDHVELETYNFESDTKLKSKIIKKKYMKETKEKDYSYYTYELDVLKSSCLRFRYRNKKDGTNANDDSEWSDFTGALYV